MKLPYSIKSTPTIGLFIQARCPAKFIGWLRRLSKTAEDKPLRLKTAFGFVEAYEHGQGWWRFIGEDETGRDVRRIDAFLKAMLHRYERETRTILYLEEHFRNNPLPQSAAKIEHVGKVAVIHRVTRHVDKTIVEVPAAPAPSNGAVLHIPRKPASPEMLQTLIETVKQKKPSGHRATPHFLGREFSRYNQVQSSAPAF